MIDSVRTRLTIWYVGILAAVLVLFSVGVYALLSRHLYDRLDRTLSAVTQVALASLTHDAEEGQSLEGAAQSTADELYDSEQRIAILDANGRLLAESGPDDDIPMTPPELATVSEGEPLVVSVLEVNDDDDMHRVAIRRVTVPGTDRTYVVAVSQEEDVVEDELEALREILFVAVPVALLLVGVGGWFLARKSLEPALAMSEQARRIGAEHLDRRLHVENPNDELGRLAANFNELLDRLGDAFALQRRFMADASHELRTPLSVLQTAADVTLAQEPRSEDEYRDAIAIMDEQTRRLSRTVHDMFMLARADSGQYPLRESTFYADEVATEAARAVSVLADRKGVEIDVDVGAEIESRGDEDLIRQMTLNLLDNAVKHTPAGGRVELRVERVGDDVVVTVSDTGTGIAPEEQARIFERFYRVDKARSRSESATGSGAGLGLAIARWIAGAHGGRLDLVSSDERGSCFRAVLPISRPSAK